MKIGYYQIVETGKTVWCGAELTARGLEANPLIYSMTHPPDNNYISAQGLESFIEDVDPCTSDKDFSDCFLGLVSIYDLTVK